jgi:hypothetical protein
LANDVDAVNQYAAPIHAATIAAARRAGRAQDDENQPRGRHCLGGPLPRAGSDLGRELQDRQVEHGMREPRAEHGADQLRDDVEREFVPRQLAAPRHHGADGRIEVRATHGAEHLDEDVETANRCQGVREERDGSVAASKTLGHDPRADHDREQQRRAARFAAELADEVHRQRLPMFADFLVQRRLVERFHRQREHELDPPSHRDRGVAECLFADLVGAVDGSGVGHAPVGRHRLAGPHRAHLACGLGRIR